MHELTQPLRHRQRLAGHWRCTMALERATQLQRVERVAARNVVEPPKHRPGEREPDPSLQETVDRAEAQRRDLEETCPLELEQRSGCRQPQAVRKEKAGRLLAKASPRERKHGAGRGVEPLDVVHGHEQRALGSVDAKRAEKRDGDRALFGGRALRLLEQERNSKCVGLGRRERVEQLSQSFVKEIAESCEGEPCFGRGRASLEHSKADSPSRLDTCVPQSGLADARVTIEDERGRAGLQRAEKGIQRLELFLTADDVDVGRGLHHRSPC